MIPFRTTTDPTFTTAKIDHKGSADQNDIDSPVLSAPSVQFDSRHAELPLLLGRDNEVVSCRYNDRVLRSLEEALTSSQVALRIKRKIFVNAIDYGYVSDLNRILDDIRRKGLRINLDHIDLSGLSLGSIDRDEAERRFLDDGLMFLMKLPHLNLENVSAVRANFSHSFLLQVDLRGADLTSANFTCSTFSLATLIDANLCGATFDRTEFSMCKAQGLVTNDSGLQARQLPSKSRISLKLNGTHTSRRQDLRLQEFTLQPRLNRCADSGCLIL